MPRLRVRPVRSAGNLGGALSPGRADEYGEFDGEILIVDDEEAAEQLVETRNNVVYADQDADPAPGVESLPRTTVGGDGSEDSGLCNTEMSDGSICERPADECQYH